MNFFLIAYWLITKLIIVDSDWVKIPSLKSPIPEHKEKINLKSDFLSVVLPGLSETESKSLETQDHFSGSRNESSLTDKTKRRHQFGEWKKRDYDNGRWKQWNRNTNSSPYNLHENDYWSQFDASQPPEGNRNMNVSKTNSATPIILQTSKLDEAKETAESAKENKENVMSTEGNLKTEKKLETSTTPTAPKLEPKKSNQMMKIVKVTSKQNAGSMNFANFWNFLKNVQHSFLSRTAKGITDKVKMLREFRDKMLINIEDRIKNLWPPMNSRQKRNLMGAHSHEGGMDFPSAEGALITIGFLTFAVFLIKLVLQVINTIKSKHYSFNGFDTTSIGAVKIIQKNRNARNFSLSESDNVQNMMKILNSLKKFNGR